MKTAVLKKNCDKIVNHVPVWNKLRYLILLSITPRKDVHRFTVKKLLNLSADESVCVTLVHSWRPSLSLWRTCCWWWTQQGSFTAQTPVQATQICGKSPGRELTVSCPVWRRSSSNRLSFQVLSTQTQYSHLTFEFNHVQHRFGCG